MRTTILHKTLREQVADTIRRKILHHELEPGMRITESELATEFGVSHGPVREALRQLEQEGLIEYKRNSGCSVRNISIPDVAQALLLHGSYELTAVRSCGGRISDHGLRTMEDALESMKHMDISDYSEPILLDNRFHKALIDEAHMPYLVNAWNALDFVTFFAFYKQIDDSTLFSPKQYDTHKAIFDVFVSADYRAICGIICEHYNNSITRILQDHQMTEDDCPFSFDILNPNLIL